MPARRIIKSYCGPIRHSNHRDFGGKSSSDPSIDCWSLALKHSFHPGALFSMTEESKHFQSQRWGREGAAADRLIAEDREAFRKLAKKLNFFEKSIDFFF